MVRSPKGTAWARTGSALVNLSEAREATTGAVALGWDVARHLNLFCNVCGRRVDKSGAADLPRLMMPCRGRRCRRWRGRSAPWNESVMGRPRGRRSSGVPSGLLHSQDCCAAVSISEREPIMLLVERQWGRPVARWELPADVGPQAERLVGELVFAPLLFVLRLSHSFEISPPTLPPPPRPGSVVCPGRC